MLNIPTITLLILTAVAFAVPLPARAVETAAETKESDGGGPVHMLTGNEPSYFALAHDENDLENHVEFYLSIKYPLLTGTIESWLGERSRLYFNYNGKYDFYVFSRDSSPIISRRQNPGLMYEYLRPPVSHFHLQSFKTGYFHESNGQTVDTIEEYRTLDNAADYVSRGWDYIPLTLNFAVSQNRHGFFGNLYAAFEGRYFLDHQLFRHDREDEIFWEPVAEQPRIEDYDGIRTKLSTVLVLPYIKAREIKFCATLRSGSREFNLSQRYEATFRLFDLPLYVYYFRGYGIELATYHEKGVTYGIGVEFW